MHAAVRALLDQIIDYAGLFPPAKLPLEQALCEYLHFKKASPHRWMLGRFVCPTLRLQELLTLAKGHPDAALLQVTALGQQSSTASEPLPHLTADLQAIDEFRRYWGDGAVIDNYEVALPQGHERRPPSTEQVATFEHAQLRGFLEIPRTPDWRQDLVDLGALLSGTGVGLKLRAGSTTASAFPSDGDVAFYIDYCRQTNRAWKATAGLHHPRRHWDQYLQVWHHGFLNLFCAGMLAWANPLNRTDISCILADREAEQFRFDEKQIAWKDWACPISMIIELRANFATSFGSCSFAEPCQDLLAMGLLDPDAA